LRSSTRRDPRFKRKRVEASYKIVLVLSSDEGDTQTHEIRAKLCEGRHVTVLGKVELEGSSDGLHDLRKREKRKEKKEKKEWRVVSGVLCTRGRTGTNLGLGSRSDTGDGESDVDGRSDSLEEELGLEEDLSITVGETESAGGRRGGRKVSLRDGDNVGGTVEGGLHQYTARKRGDDATHM
jgi:hypothetical protein